MTLDELIKLARERIPDVTLPQKLRPTQMEAFARQAMLEAAERALCIRLDVNVSLAAATGTYVLPDTTIDITRVKPSLDSMPLVKSTIPVLDLLRPGWETTAGAPDSYLLDFHVATTDPITHVTTRAPNLVITPIPNAAYVARNPTLHLRGYRRPTSTEDLDVIPPEWQPELIYWVLYQALTTGDPDLDDEDRAAEYKSVFEALFGHRKSAVWERVSRTVPVGPRAIGRRLV